MFIVLYSVLAKFKAWLENYNLPLKSLRNLPASMAFLAASLKSFTTEGTSSVVSRLGVENSAVSIPLARICGVIGLSVQDIGAWPFGWNPVAKTNI